MVDNGSGIRADNYASLALKHHTSKLNNFHDLTLVQTFGFRGEALSSLCELSEVQVVTATKEEEPVGTVLEMNRDGTIRSQDKRVARQVRLRKGPISSWLSISLKSCIPYSAEPQSLSLGFSLRCPSAGESCSKTSSESLPRLSPCFKHMPSFLEVCDGS